MAAAFLLAALGASHVAAQAEHTDPAFAYLGCSSLDLACFEAPIVFPDGQMTPEACQGACRDHHFAALLPNACHCGNNASGVTVIDEASCNSACMGDPALGRCGGVDQGRAVANVYNWPGPPVQEQGPVTFQTGHAAPLPAPVTESPCSRPEHLPSVPVPTATLLTPLESAPEAPVFSSTSPSEEVPPPKPAFPITPQAGESWTTSCTQHGGSVTEMRTPLHISTSETPEGPTGNTADPAAPCTTQGPNPPDYSTNGEARPTPGRSESGNVARTFTHPGEPSDGPPERTLWPAAPDASELVPSQVPVNGATDGLVSPLSVLGGLALIAAMMM